MATGLQAFAEQNSSPTLSFARVACGFAGFFSRLKGRFLRGVVLKQTF